MKIETTRFGDMEVPDEDIFSLPEGIVGFPEDQRFVLLEHDSEGTPFRWLQSASSPAMAFIVMDPNLLIDDFRIQFDEENTQFFGAAEVDEDFALMSLVSVPRDNPMAMSANLRAPIVVHLEKRIGRQIVLANEDYPIRHQIFPDQGEDDQSPQEASS